MFEKQTGQSGMDARSPTTYYVAPNGNNSNPGTFDRPWATPAYGAKQLQPGDTLIIRSGRYILRDFGEDMITPPQGRPGAWITIKGETDKRPVLVGTNNLYAAFEISNASYLRIENLEITSDLKDPFRGGISAWDPAAHIVLNNLHIHHLDEGGIDLRDIVDLTLLNSRIEYCGFGAIGGPRGNQGGWRNILIKNCRLSYSGHYYQGGPGPSPYDRPDGFGIEPSNGPIEIADTVVEHNRGDGLDSKAANTYIHHCIVANNSCDGIKVWGNNSKIENCLIYGTGDGDTSPSPWAGIVIDQIEQAGSGFQIINTTLANDRREHGYLMYVQYGGGVPITLMLKNCIMSHGPGRVYIGSNVTFTSDHNLFYLPGQNVPIEVAGREYTAAEIESGALGPGNLARDPLFVKLSLSDPDGYQLQAGSPAINAGTIQGAPADDLRHRARPYGSAPDMGAFEWQGPAQPPTVVKSDPVNNATGVPVNKKITVTFSESVTKGSTFSKIALKNAKGKTVAVTKSISGNQLTIIPRSNLAYNTRHTVTIPAKAVKDLEGNPLVLPYTFSFTTKAKT